PDTHNPYTGPDPAWIQSSDNPTVTTIPGSPQPRNAPPLENTYQAKKMSVADIPGEDRWKIEARPVSAEFSLGEPVFVDLQVTNLNSEPASIDLGGDGKTNLRVTITGPDGLAKPV